MQAKCIKTGAHVYLAEYGEYIVTDLMLTGDVYHFDVVSPAHVSRTPHSGYPTRPHLTVHSLALPHRRHPHRYTLLAHAPDCDYDHTAP
jgi:hypothetical protein